MKSTSRRMLLLLALVLCWGVTTKAYASQDDAFWQVQTSLYTRHFSPDSEHNNRQALFALERNEASGLLYGAATFRNSFAQRSFYGYVGKRFDSADYPAYLKVSGGLLQGYKGEYRDKIPLNRFGVAPVIIPALGLHLGSFTAEVALLGVSAAMINIGVRL